MMSKVHIGRGLTDALNSGHIWDNYLQGCQYRFSGPVPDRGLIGVDLCGIHDIFVGSIFIKKILCF